MVARYAHRYEHSACTVCAGEINGAGVLSAIPSPHPQARTSPPPCPKLAAAAEICYTRSDQKSRQGQRKDAYAVPQAQPAGFILFPILHKDFL